MKTIFRAVIQRQTAFVKVEVDGVVQEAIAIHVDPERCPRVDERVGEHKDDLQAVAGSQCRGRTTAPCHRDRCNHHRLGQRVPAEATLIYFRQCKQVAVQLEITSATPDNLVLPGPAFQGINPLRLSGHRFTRNKRLHFGQLIRRGFLKRHYLPLTIFGAVGYGGINEKYKEREQWQQLPIFQLTHV